MIRCIAPKPCPHNGAVVCDDDTKCNSCGWNPKVAKARKAKLLKKYKGVRKNGND